jgi:hypothetical protein
MINSKTLSGHSYAVGSRLDYLYFLNKEKQQWVQATVLRTENDLLVLEVFHFFISLSFFGISQLQNYRFLEIFQADSPNVIINVPSNQFSVKIAKYDDLESHHKRNFQHAHDRPHHIATIVFVISPPCFYLFCLF